MKRLLLLAWLTFIFVGTCTQSLDAFLFKGVIQFDFISVPAWNNVGLLGPAETVRFKDVVGHFIMFSILTVLVYLVRKSFRSTLFIVINFAVLTEIAQRFFDRGTELYDLLANFAGILTATVITWVIVLRLRRPSE